MYKQVPSIQVKSRQVPSIRMPSIGLLNRREGREPSPYIELPYIVSKGNSWADTGLYLDPSIHRVQGSFIVDDLSIKTYYTYRLEGARSNNPEGISRAIFFIRKLSESTYEIRRDWGTQESDTNSNFDGVVREVGKEYFFDVTPEYTEIGGLRIDRIAKSGGASINSYFIGNVNDPTLSDIYTTPGIRGTKRIFSVYATGEIIGESIPVLNKDTNTFGYFDKVSGKYLENKGTEPWTAAYEAWVYQMGRPLSYLTATGGSYIDTKEFFTEKTDIIWETSNAIAGRSGGIESSAEPRRFGSYNYADNKFRVYNHSRYAEVDATSLNVFIKKQTGASGVYVDDVKQLDPLVTEPFTMPYSILCAGATRYNTAANFVGNEGLKTKYFNVIQEGVETSKLISFITWEGVKGYLNLVNRELLLNQGTGEFQVPMIPVYAINWQDEEFDPIAGKVAEIGTGYGNIFFNDWTEAQKQTFRGKKLKVSWKLSAKDVVINESSYNYIGFPNQQIIYNDGTKTTIRSYSAAAAIFTGLISPYTLAEDYSISTVIQISDKEIESINSFQPWFSLPRIQSGELKAYDLKWEVDVPEWEIDAIESLNASGISAHADYQDNINMLNQIGIK